MVFFPKSVRDGVAERKVGAAVGLAANMAAGMLVCTYLGRLIGKKLGHEDGGTLVGVFLGLFYGGYEVWKVVRILQHEANEDEAAGDGSESGDSQNREIPS